MQRIILFFNYFVGLIERRLTNDHLTDECENTEYIDMAVYKNSLFIIEDYSDYFQSFSLK